jgi:adenine/guanine phosphoribosyltransferase-like PRPP-binding protein
MRYVRGPEYLEALGRLREAVKDVAADAVVGIKRSGFFPAVYLSHQLGVPMFADAEIDRIPETIRRVLLVDSVARTGKTMERVKRRLLVAGKEVTTAVLYLENATSYRVDRHLEVATDLVHFFYERLPWTPPSPPES